MQCSQGHLATSLTISIREPIWLDKHLGLLVLSPTYPKSVGMRDELMQGAQVLLLAKYQQGTQKMVQ